jgi:gamma-glutamyltranspeptidase/glutathione hydrolase
MDRNLVVAPQSETAEIAAQVLASGGNAFDAAVAGAFTQGVVDPHRSGIGGFGAATLYVAAERESYSVTFFGRAGSKASPDMWAEALEGPAPDGFGYILRGKVNDVGYQAITVPGMVAGLGSIHDRFGTMPWRDLVHEAAGMARRGFLVGPQLAAFWRRPGLYGRVSTRDRLALTEAGRALWLPGGEPPRAGDVVPQETLAGTYDRIAEAGPWDFYTGELGAAIAADWKANDAIVTRDDLADYEVLWEEPLRGLFLGRQVATTPLPGGGVALLQALTLAERSGLLVMPLNSPPYVHLLGGILSAVQDDRVRFHGDPDFGGDAPQTLLDPVYLDGLLERSTGAAVEESPDTTELVVVDYLGNAIVLCHSLGYGSGVFTPDLGFMYNNAMSGFDPRPGRPNSIAPGKARGTAIAQTLVFEGEEPWLILGSPGGSRITAALTQVLINVVHFGLDLQDAVCRPRLDAYRRTIVCDARMPFTLEEALGDRWEIKRSPNPFGMIGRVYGAALSDDEVRPGYDPGEPGTAREV